jgi:3-oxoacyl-ACP reductase-like protein
LLLGWKGEAADACFALDSLLSGGYNSCVRNVFPSVRKERCSMKDFQDKVAVVTGAASGIGHALAEKSAQEGMK